MTHNAATRTVCLIMCVMCAANHRGDGATNETNLLRHDDVRAISGTLSGDGLAAMLRGDDALRRIRIPPHDLGVKWSRPVQLNTLRVQWQDETIYGIHYGLEYWDASAKRYRLAFEERTNTQPERTHTFSTITTTRIRFSVFKHPLQYNAVVINDLQLTYSDDKRGP
ncbi:MAG: hypothetical protein OSB41_11340 [Kiritimatiellae bacterium]|nr:hypothetical protein [Kiritimatiellia bacterium]